MRKPRNTWLFVLPSTLASNACLITSSLCRRLSDSFSLLIQCLAALQDYFAIDKWQINQPIILRDIYILLDRIEGVQTVKNIAIINKVGTSLGYSQYSYDTTGATNGNVVYPSLDPMIFEVKYPNTDIQGRVVPL